MLLFVLACLGAAILTATLAPLALTVRRWQIMHPRAALTAWFAAWFLGVFLALAALTGSVVGAVTASTAAPHASAVLLTGAGWLGLGAFGAAAAFITASASTAIMHQDAAGIDRAVIARVREEREGFTLVRFISEQLVACAVPGRQPEILISSALTEALSAPQLQAVLAHEYAHLRQHHGWALRIAQINALCLPRTRPGRALQRATALLIELAADDAAARQAGPAHLANALTVLSRAAGAAEAEGMWLRAERLASRRWPRPSRRRLPRPIRIGASG